MSQTHTHTNTHTPDTHIQYTHTYNTHTHTHIHYTHTGPGWLINMKGTRSSSYPPIIIIMPHFSQHKRDDDVWYSQPFYSRPGGYKLRLCVIPNGVGSGKGTHVAVYVYLMKGENDHQLQWPFKLEKR